MKIIGFGLLLMILLTGCIANKNVDFKKANAKILNNLEKVEKKQSNKKLRIRYYSNGVIGNITPIVNGERHGTQRWYTDEGKLKTKRIYVHDEQIGEDIKVSIGK